jgi:hypothetical protein
LHAASSIKPARQTATAAARSKDVGKNFTGSNFYYNAG